MGRHFPTLKPFYYLDHFNEAFEFVERNYHAVLCEEEQRYLSDFRALDRQSQALLARMANRKGDCFELRKLHYDEIPDLAGSIAALRFSGFIRIPEAPDFGTLLAALTKAEVLQRAARAGLPLKGWRSLKKGDLILKITGEGEFASFFPAGERADFCVLKRLESLDFIRFLYFGKEEESLKAFALRDLGIVRTRGPSAKVGPRFSSRELAHASFTLGRVRARIREAGLAELEELAREVGRWPQSREPEIEALHTRCLARLGRAFEREGESASAIAIYRKSSEHPCRERLIRLLHPRGEEDEVKNLLGEIMSSPSTDEELLFAQDFRARKFGKARVGSLTRTLREARVIEVDESMRDSAERAAMAHFASEGWDAFWVENHLWSALFGILFWDELQTGAQSGSANEFDPRPIQLRDGSFFLRNEAAIISRKELIAAGAAGPALERTFTTHFGESNGVFRWRKSDLALLKRFLEVAPPEAVARQLLRMAQQPSLTTGYPDLLLLGKNEARFVEIKAEGDQLQRHQLAQIVALKKAGFQVEVVRVNWCIDPMQDYVVVDIETTGGRAHNHRVTEIGAVKISGGEVVATYQTLLNPGRSIPGKITRLTGITDAMVEDAPHFSEVADEFRAFVGEAIFVAHSVRFDYGFLRAEFERLGETFRCPTLCTVVAMRKYFPGLDSYSLGNLCREFEIPLASHHRALCDATATAELLKMINRKRIAS